MSVRKSKGKAKKSSKINEKPELKAKETYREARSSEKSAAPLFTDEQIAEVERKVRESMIGEVYAELARLETESLLEKASKKTSSSDDPFIPLPMFPPPLKSVEVRPLPILKPDADDTSEGDDNASRIRTAVHQAVNEENSFSRRTGIPISEVRKTVYENPKLFSGAYRRPVRRFLDPSTSSASNHFLRDENVASLPSTITFSKPYDPELYERRVLEGYRETEWAIEAIERGSTIVVDPVDELVALLKRLEECGVAVIEKTGQTDTTFTLSVTVRVAEEEVKDEPVEKKEVAKTNDDSNPFEDTIKAFASATEDANGAKYTVPAVKFDYSDYLPGHTKSS